MSDVATDSRFARTYECRVVEERTGLTEASRRLFPVDRAGSQDGVTLDVSSAAGDWLATFAFGRGRHAPALRSWVIGLPDEKTICVVAAGEGYLVPADAPERWEPVPLVPVVDVRVLDSGVVVLASHTEIVAYDRSGQRWVTTRISWDGLTITAATDHEVRGEYWDVRSEATRAFSVNVETGMVQGGIEMPNANCE